MTDNIDDILGNLEFKSIIEDLKKDASDMERQCRNYLNKLDILNSSFPATKEFLQARGLTLVSELDDDSKKELVKHLQQQIKNK